MDLVPHGRKIVVQRTFLSLVSSCLSQDVLNNLANLLGKQRWHGVANLDVLGRAMATEEIIVWKCLQACGFANRQTSALQRIGMNIVVPILRNMRNDGCARTRRNLDAEAVIEVVLFFWITNVYVSRQQIRREML